MHRNPGNRRALRVSQIDIDVRSAQRELARGGKQACGCRGESPLEVKPMRRWGVAWGAWKAWLSSQDQEDHSERWRQGEEGHRGERLSRMVGLDTAEATELGAGRFWELSWDPTQVPAQSWLSDFPGWGAPEPLRPLMFPRRNLCSRMGPGIPTCLQGTWKI